uniref:Uncharacterized protein n=1 Tax=Glossina pallidipes TaxID=7398 RepID=A0A1A9ZDK1_GLOPL
MSFIQFDNVVHISEEDEEEYEDEDFTISIQELPMDLPEIERIILPPREEGEPEKVEIKISMRKIESSLTLHIIGKRSSSKYFSWLTDSETLKVKMIVRSDGIYRRRDP